MKPSFSKPAANISNPVVTVIIIVTAERNRARGRPLKHLQVAVRIAKRGDRAAADAPVDADGLARAIVDEIDFRFAQQNRLAVFNLKLHLRERPDHARAGCHKLPEPMAA